MPTASQNNILGGPVRSLIYGLDALLRRSQGVFEFTDDPACILRISLARANSNQVLADGTRIEPGDLLVNIHLWNERLPRMPREGADLAWAQRMYRQFILSLRLLAKYIASNPGPAAARAIYGEPGLFTTGSLDAGLGALTRLGFEIQRPRAAAGPWQRFAEFWQNLYSYALLWTFNPGSLWSRTFWGLERCQIWMSRATLERLYGPGPQGSR